MHGFENMLEQKKPHFIGIMHIDVRKCAWSVSILVFLTINKTHDFHVV